ncbi:hypothetical protein E1A91_A12G086300v1 [Gossypium mustelinum]|uniref:Uncharacterized protein n=1 Tax=Gossypium mustelinum TaxID=34275 RepID=A0A5D2WRM3_GOSMU|nr:hypothetical protein E1A91_A12G086300v1 [Gossypium mustelinum]TYJ04353.1 hypothetical protein E1A91_A12G086300v1 [Gossypium mustelinum]TYJ04354.1 hypothetical protein E1A91_A12G086300v1 [Gossypium mustelinum]
MAVVLAMVVHGMGLLVKTLWGVQERRFSATFETMRSAAISMTTAFGVRNLTSANHLSLQN